MLLVTNLEYYPYIGGESPISRFTTLINNDYDLFNCEYCDFLLNGLAYYSERYRKIIFATVFCYNCLNWNYGRTI